MNHEKYATINVLTTFNYVCQNEGHLIFAVFIHITFYLLFS